VNESAVTSQPPLGALLAAAHRRCRIALDEALRPLGVEARHFGTLRALGEHGPLSQRQLMDLQDVDKSAMVRIVDDLERAGLVQRRPHPHDRRAHAVHLTATGRRRLAKASGVAAAVDEQLFGELAGTDQARLRDMLQTVITSAGRAKP
jgi:DNA-binding MarR family transcriptional regulator